MAVTGVELGPGGGAAGVLAASSGAVAAVSVPVPVATGSAVSAASSVERAGALSLSCGAV